MISTIGPQFLRNEYFYLDDDGLLISKYSGN